MITLFHAPRSRSTRIIWLLEELNTPYAIVPVSIYRPMSGEGEADPTNPHPDKRVPALRHGDAFLAESVAIVAYLTETFPAAGLAPPIGDPRRGAYLTWLAWYAAELEPIMFASMQGELPASPNKQRSYDTVLRRLENALWQSPYLMGDHFSGADFLVSTALAFARQAFPANKLFDDYIDRCRTRPAALRGFALDEAYGLQNAA